MSGAADRAACRACAAFRGDAADIEAALPGLRSMGSAYAAVRSDDGLCRLHERFVSARATCAAFQPAVREVLRSA